MIANIPWTAVQYSITDLASFNSLLPRAMLVLPVVRTSEYHQQKITCVHDHHKH